MMFFKMCMDFLVCFCISNKIFWCQLRNDLISYINLLTWIQIHLNYLGLGHN